MNQIIIDVGRHGKTKNNEEAVLNEIEDQLTEEGERQALELGIRLNNAGIKYDHVLVSPLIRAQHSAQLIMQGLGLKDYHIIEDLRERDFESVAGLPYSEIPNIPNAEILVTNGATYFLSGGGAETFAELLERAKRVLAEIKSKYSGRILIVCHGDIGKMLYAAFYGRDLKETLQLFHFGNSEVITLDDNTSYDDVYLNLEA